jgi:hypothetical protein
MIPLHGNTQAGLPQRMEDPVQTSKQGSQRYGQAPSEIRGDTRGHERFVATE